jgi:hypothetical protein
MVKKTDGNRLTTEVRPSYNECAMKKPTDLFTVQINNLMKDDAHKCAHARHALALYASGDVEGYLNARLEFSHAFAGRAKRDQNVFLLTMIVANVAMTVAFFLSIK